MDKSKKYTKLLKELFEEYKQNNPSFSNPNLGQEVNSFFVMDETNGIFTWFHFGWTKQGRVDSINLFVRLEDGKIHIEEDWTEEGIGTILMERGVPKKDIVVEFHPPEMRQYTDFALS